jgi:hypothetical protein
MSAAQRTLPKIKFGFNTRPTLLLCVVEDTLQENRIMNPVPSRMTLIRWIESGILEGKKTPTGIWIVYQDSFESFVRNLQTNLQGDAVAA